jgi:DMSO/TMAO reductase YedYZ molybdopterin-dependent catalytic subunit
MALGLAGFAVGKKLTDTPQQYGNVSTMPVNLEGTDTFAPRNHPIITLEHFRYYSVAPVPNFHPATWRLQVNGLVGKRLVFTYGDLYRLPSVYLRADFRCVTGWVVHDNVWRGIQLSSLFKMAGLDPSARFVSFSSFDGLYRESYTLDQAMSPHAIVAFEHNGKPLETEAGAPARIIHADMYGYKSLKWLSDITLTRDREHGYWERRGWCYPILGKSNIDDCA